MSHYRLVAFFSVFVMHLKYISSNTVLKIQFRSVKCTVVPRIRQNFEQLFIPIQARQGDYCADVNKLLQKLFEGVNTVHACLNLMNVNYYVHDK